ncbi:MAG: YgjV family protein [Erysipelotrichaceae bacterium]|nr:YgjV family protein [Erysipelotrichaceae bacterium]
MWTNPFYVIAFILGIIIIIYSLMMFLLPKKNSHLFIKLLFDIAYIAQMLFIFFATKSYAVFIGIASNTVGAVRDIVFITSDKKEHRLYWTIVLCALMVAFLHFSYDSPVSYLPVFGTLINTTALSFKKKQNTCALTMFGQLFFISYYSLLLKESDFLTILNIISASMLFISAVVGFIIPFVKAARARNAHIYKI